MHSLAVSGVRKTDDDGLAAQSPPTPDDKDINRRWNMPMELTCCLNGEKAPTAVEAKRSVKVFILRLRRRRIDFMEAALLRPLSLLLCNACRQQVGGPCLLVYFRITNGVDHRHRRFKRAPTTTKKQKSKIGANRHSGVVTVSASSWSGRSSLREALFSIIQSSQKPMRMSCCVIQMVFIPERLHFTPEQRAGAYLPATFMFRP